MHFYPHNIGDFNNSTRHLTRVERSVYRDAIERYYDTESPLPANDIERLYRVLLCSTDDEKRALNTVLGEFFTVVDGAYRHDRCDLEIEKYRSNSSAKARAGKASAEARKNKSQHTNNTSSTCVEQNNKQEPITNNHKPLTNITTDAQQAGVEAKARRKCRLPADFLITDDRRQIALGYWKTKNRFDLNPDDEFQKFTNYHLSNGKPMLDWEACWRTWYTNAVGFNRPLNSASHNQPKTIEQTGNEIAERSARIKATLQKNGAFS
jgi:uncharacterized protein YdaU (DUF1376 family)